MHPDRPADPDSAPDGGESPSAIEQMLEVRKRAGGSLHDSLEAIEHERSKAHGRQLARERGEAVPPADDEERE